MEHQPISVNPAWGWGRSLGRMGPFAEQDGNKGVAVEADQHKTDHGAFRKVLGLHGGQVDGPGLAGRRQRLQVALA